MSDLSLNTVSFHPVQQAQPAPPPAPPQPPKSQSDHKPLNASTSSRGPAVVLSGAVAQGAQGSTQSAQSGSTNAPGQHINHVI